MNGESLGTFSGTVGRQPLRVTSFEDRRDLLGTSTETAGTTGSRRVGLPPGPSLRTASKSSSTPGDESDVWRQKQLEIRDLQEASRTLLGRVSTPQTASPSRPLFGGLSTPNGLGSPDMGARSEISDTGTVPQMGDEAVLGSTDAILERINSRRPSNASSMGLLGSTTSLANASLVNGRSSNFVVQASARETDELNMTSASMAMSSVANDRLGASDRFTTGSLGGSLLSMQRQATPDVDEVSLAGSTSAVAVLGGNSLLPATPPLDRSRRSSATIAPIRAGTSVGNDGRTLEQENAALRAEVMELRRGAAERDRELRLQAAVAKRVPELREQLAEAERRIADLSDELERMRKAQDISELLKGDGVVHKTVRSYIEKDLATMRAERRSAEQLLRADGEKWRERAAKFEADLQESEDAARLMREELSNAGSNEDRRAAQRLAAAEAATMERLRQAESAASDQAGKRESQLADARQMAMGQQMAQLRLTEELQTAISERQSLQDNLELQESKFTEERKKARREIQRKTAELQKTSDEFREEAEEAMAKSKETERTMHGRLSTARQDRERAEKRLKTQLQSLQQEYHAHHGRGHEAAEVMAKWGEFADELSEFQNSLRNSEEECADLKQKVVHESKRNMTLQKKVKEAGNEAKQALETELLRERSRAHDEAWERLAAVEERHTNQMNHVHKAHAREIQVVAEQVQEVRGDLEKRLEGEIARSAARELELEKLLEVEQKRAAQSEDQNLSISSTLQELRTELASARAEADNAVAQHEALLNVLRHEREVADSQFQQLLRQTEEKQRAIGRLQSQEGDDEVDALSPGGTARSTAAARPELAALASGQLAGAALLSPELPGTDRSAHLGTAGGGSLAGSPRGSPSTVVSTGPPAPAAGSAIIAAAGGLASRADDGVDFMLRNLSFEREAQMARGLAAQLERTLGDAVGATESANNGDRQTHASSVRKLLEQLLTVHERICQHACDEQARAATIREREKELREHLGRHEARAQRRCDEAVRQARAHHQEQINGLEAEARRAQHRLEIRFEQAEGENSKEVRELVRRLSTEAAELQGMRTHCEKLAACEADTAKQALMVEEAMATKALKKELDEARLKADQDLLDEQCQANMGLAKLEKAAAIDCMRLTDEAVEERLRVRSELEELSQLLHKELTATRDEHSSFERRETHLEARVDQFREDVKEAETEHHEVKSGLKHEIALKNTELQALEAALQNATHRSASAESQMSAEAWDWQREVERLKRSHEEEREMLAREISQFQDEKLMLEDVLRKDEANSSLLIRHLESELQMAEAELELAADDPVGYRKGTISAETVASIVNSERVGTDRRAQRGLNITGQDTPTAPDQAALLERLAGRKQANRLRETMEKQQEEHDARVAEVEEMCQQEHDEKAVLEQQLKDQLRSLREERMKERQHKDRQIDKLKKRVEELEQAAQAAQRQQNAEAAAHRRQNDEYAERLERVKQDKRQVGMTLQESRKERARVGYDLEELEQHLVDTEALLSSAEEQCMELNTERYAAERSASAWQLENSKLEAQVNGNQAVLARETHMLQELQMEREALRLRGRELSNEAQEARSLAERLCQAFEEEIEQLLPALPEDAAQELVSSRRGIDGAPSEAAVVQTFQALARWVADLAQQNAQLRYSETHGRLHLPQRAASGAASSQRPGAGTGNATAQLSIPNSGGAGNGTTGGSPTPGTRQVANLQKELVKLREENQELRLELQRTRRSSNDGNGVESPPGKNPVSPGAASAAGSTCGAMSNAGSAAVSEGRTEPAPAPRPLPFTSTPSTGGMGTALEQRQKMRKLQMEKQDAENQLTTLKQEFSRQTLALQSEIETLQATIWEKQHHHEGHQDASQKKYAQLERKARILEGKLRERTEREQELTKEKEAVEDQLDIAAKQLEALLAEEHRDNDLQRDLVGLSKQFELLHGKHRAQLSKAAEQGQALQREREIRRQLEEKLRDASTQLEEDVATAELRHTEQVAQMKETVQSLRRNSQAKDRELQEALAEQATLTCEHSAMKSRCQQKDLTSQELQDEVKRLQADLEKHHTMLREARERGPGARDAIARLHQQEDECANMHKNLEAADAARHHAQSEVRAKRAEIEELKISLDRFREDARQARDGMRRAEEALEQSQDSMRFEQRSRSADRWEHEEHSPSRGTEFVDQSSAVRGATATRRAMVDRSSDRKAPFERGARRHDRFGPGDGDSEEPDCLIRTTEDLQTESRRMPLTRPSAMDNQGGLLSALEEIKETLNSRERELQERKAGRSEMRGGDSSGAGKDDFSATAMTAPLDEAVVPSRGGSLADVERDFGEYARSIGFRGDVGPLWAEAQAQAATLAAGGGHQGLELSLPPHGGRSDPPPRAPIATDVELMSPSEMQFPTYPQSPPSGGTADGFQNEGENSELGGGYPHSPGRSADWQLAMDAQGPGSDWSAVTQPAGQRSDASAAIQADEASTTASGNSQSNDGRGNQAIQPGLPANAKETFRRAEALTEQQKFAEAVPLFEQVLQMLGAGPGPVSGEAETAPPAVIAEVWAHRGVAMQSLDKVQEAIDSYRHAVALDTSLHVCFANLATLHAYLHEKEQALEYIAKAIALDPGNSTYASIRRHLDDGPPTAVRGEAPTAANAA